MNLSLARALRMAPADCVALIGAGGKTTALFKLARELTPAALVTATTHLGVWQSGLADRHIPSEAASLDEINEGFQGVLLVTGKSEGDRAKPVSEGLLNWLDHYRKARSLPLLVEADGSRMKPLKAWAEHEPPIPGFADLVVQVAGMSGVGKPLTEEHVHRAERFAELGGLKVGDRVSAQALARVLIHSDGGLKNIPATARRVVLLNQADTPELQSAAQAMTCDLLTAYQAVLVASLTSGAIHAIHEPMAGVVLAAGESKRFGRPKQLLDWKGQPFVRVVAQTALRAGLSPVIVVTGANAEQVEAAVEDLNVTVIRNTEWADGQGSSIRAGVLALTQPASREGGAVFLLADQPQVTTTVIQALMEKHAQGLHPVVAPMVLDRRGNPVLFDRVTFPDLLQIEGDTGGRAIFHKHVVEYLPWHDDSLLLDVDTPEQYQRLISNGDV